mmetsp:Transcript_16964/g.12133  ORF Transcript_16964/g.12133 Transcript_16964/m.12133 type:complete len:137 (-) Transcript_16964:29-439(-)
MQPYKFVDERLQCIPKNYKLSDSQKKSLFSEDRKQIQQVEVEEPYQGPVFVRLVGGEEPPEVTKDGCKKKPKQRKVAMDEAKVQGMILKLFKDQDSYKLNELSKLLNFPTTPLKGLLQTLANFDAGKKTYSLKKEF